MFGGKPATAEAETGNNSDQAIAVDQSCITIEANSVNTTMPKNIHTEGSGNQILVKSEDVLASMRFLELKNFKEYLGDDYVRSIVAFSEASRAAQRMSSDVRKKHALKSLWTAMVGGNEDLVRKIVTSRPELLLDLSAIVTDISGKEIKELTPLQAAICAGDVDMVQAIKEVLHQKLQRGVTLSFEPELEMQRQFKLIYPNGVDSEETEQQVKAQEFKTSMLNHIFTAINAATVVQVKFELNTPGINNTDSPLNTALHDFRKQFTATSNLEQIFNPFYLLNAFAMYDEQFDNFNGNENDKWDKRNLFWRQVVGYIQRHLPACYLQAFAQGIYSIVRDREKLRRDRDREKLRRDFEFRYDKGFYMRAAVGDLNNLGYKYAASGVAARPVSPYPDPRISFSGRAFSKIIADKKIRFGELIYAQSRRQLFLPADTVCNCIRYSCSIC